ncbi:hypothetical protein [Methylomonas sp. DH-1]|uniref:hypothetical protein n=1 Tax=Methylomonas sp. (strain DH-1) TaxID=1727196 RepID=UPI000A66BDF4|nr:hypothetical protein [Methylomonas sp. DH-1]
MGDVAQQLADRFGIGNRGVVSDFLSGDLSADGLRRIVVGKAVGNGVGEGVLNFV